MDRLYFWILAVLSAILILAPIRAGDLPGYDDALYAHMAKNIVLTGDWLNLSSNGGPALEHPPLLHWMEAALFSIFGFSDTAAKLPAALSGLGTILLVYWLGRRLLTDRFAAVLAMFVMATSIYFLKYSARAMTDVPFTFFFLAAVCAWLRGIENERWYLIAAVFAACAQMTRGMMGFALPVIFAIYCWISRRRPANRYAASALVITFLPLAAWYAYTILHNQAVFFGVHSTWLRNEVYGPLSPSWRRYTGAIEYLWMITKSYWPWLPFLVIGMLQVTQARDRRLSILPVWVAVVFLLCAITRSRVLRYMLPAYPAFAVLAALGLRRVIPDLYLKRGLAIITPLLAIVVLYVAIFPPVHLHAEEIKPIASAAAAATFSGQRVGFYDEGNLRFDETNQLQWYGSRNLNLIADHDELLQQLQKPSTNVFILDRATYGADVERRLPNQVLLRSGNLILFRLLT